MAKVKTEFNQSDVSEFLELLDDEQKKKDSYELVKLMEKAAGEPAQMFGSSIIGFGKYHYRYASGHEGVAPLLGFSPRKAAISLYVTSCEGDNKSDLLENLGKYKMAKACIYIKKLSDIDTEVLNELMLESILVTEKKYKRI